MPLLELKNIKVYYPIESGIFNKSHSYKKAVDNVSFSIDYGRTYGLVGKSGSGKSTIGRVISGIERNYSGELYFKNHLIDNHSNDGIKREFINLIQMIFQDYIAALNPNKSIKAILLEPLYQLKLNRIERNKEVLRLIDLIGISKSSLNRRPNNFSGGQLQRIGIARALAMKPKIIVADEPTSALDLSVQAQILNLMKDIQKEYKISYIFISHDLSVIRYMSDYTMVLNKGRIVEMGDTEVIFNKPIHIYTKKLIESIPTINTPPVQQTEVSNKKTLIYSKYDDEYYYNVDGGIYDLINIEGSHFAALKH